MITDSANAFATEILNRSRMFETYAKQSAVEYASSDNPECKAQYKKYCEFSEMLSKMHIDACRAMHAIEREMGERCEQRIIKMKNEEK